MITKPMLAGTVIDFNKIKFPVLATPKIDGIRCLRVNGKSLSRSFKEIPNRYIQEKMQGLPDGLDGELVINGGFQKTTSGVMSRDGQPEFEYWIFDYVNPEDKENFTYWERLTALACRFNITVYGFRRPQTNEDWGTPTFCRYVPVVPVYRIDQLEEYEAKQLLLGYEGICIRQLNSPYKCGRSTEKEGYLLKIKRFADAEAVISGFEEQMENCNELGKDELGYAKRSTSKIGKVGKGTLGSLIVKGVKAFHGQEFKIGTGVGLTQELRQEIWDNKHKYWGKIITYKYQPCGTLNLPRLPIFKGFRGDE